MPCYTIQNVVIKNKISKMVGVILFALTSNYGTFLCKYKPIFNTKKLGIIRVHMILVVLCYKCIQLRTNWLYAHILIYSQWDMVQIKKRNSLTKKGFYLIYSQTKTVLTVLPNIDAFKSFSANSFNQQALHWGVSRASIMHLSKSAL